MPSHLLRYDDYSATSSFVVERALIDLIAEHQRPCTFACVPFVLDATNLHENGALRLQPLTAEKVRLVQPLVDSGLIEIALHGWSHAAMSPLRDMAEFSNAMPVGTQRKLIRQGRCYLEDSFQRSVNLFVPPWNVLGSRTIEALIEEGLQLVSGGYPTPYRSDPFGQERAAPVRNVPCWVLLDETGRALKLAERWGGNDSVVGTLIHDYDFIESGYSIGTVTMNDLRNCLAAWSNIKEVVPAAVGRTVEIEGPDGWRRARDNAGLAFQFFRGFFARRFWERFVRPVYWDAATAAKLRVIAAMMTGTTATRVRDGFLADQTRVHS